MLDIIHLNSDVIQSLMFASKRILLLPVAFLVNITESNQMLHLRKIFKTRFKTFLLYESKNFLLNANVERIAIILTWDLCEII